MSTIITPDNFSPTILRAVLSSVNIKSRLENRCLHVENEGKVFIIAQTEPNHIRFNRISYAVQPDETDRKKLLRIANEFNSDLAFAAHAYVDENGALIFTHALTISGGVTEDNIALSFLEFSIECLIFDQLVEKQLAELSNDV